MTKKELLRDIDRLQGFFSFVEYDLEVARTRLSDHPGLTHEDEIKLLGLITVLKKFGEVSDEVINIVSNFIDTHKFRS